MKDAKLKQAKLDKTKARRTALARDRRVMNVAGQERRNDLLPNLTMANVQVSDLHPPQRRVRKDNPEQVETIIASIAALGFVDPITVKDNHVVDGWLRVLAAKKLGLDTVPAIVCNHLSLTQARKLALALNRIAEKGEWDLDQLKLEFEELFELDGDLSATGFTTQETDIILLDDVDQREAAEGELEPRSATPVTRLDDLWQLGPHRVICGNALHIPAVQALLMGELAHAVLMDPPFNVKIKGNVSGLGKKVHEEFCMASGEMSDPEFQDFLDQVLQRLTEVVVPRAVLFVFMDWRSIHRVYEAGEKAGLTLLNLVVWYKQNGGMGALYRSAHELLPVFCKGETPRLNRVELGRHGRDRCNVWSAPGANRRGSSANQMLEHHATPKNLSICEDAILDVTDRGEIVLDAFLGSGTTLIAAENTGRHCRGIELEPRFVDVSIRRWERLTGLQATLVSTGQTFAEVEALRVSSRDHSSAPVSDGEGEA